MTQSDWLYKLKTFVPDWFYDETVHANAILDAMAALMADHDDELNNYLNPQMFISTATGSFLDLLGHDRGVERIAGELDDNYRVRVQLQSLISRADLPDLISIINSLLISGKAYIHEDSDGEPFIGRSTFISRNVITIPLIKDAFTILIDKQKHAPYSFIGRKQFVGRSTYVGSIEDNLQVLQNIVQALNDNRAFGALYRIVERLS